MLPGLRRHLSGLASQLGRLAKAYVDGLADEDEDEFQKRVLRSQLESLVILEEVSPLTGPAGRAEGRPICKS